MPFPFYGKMTSYTYLTLSPYAAVSRHSIHYSKKSYLKGAVYE
ncbi:hypothetical protein Zymop_0773 [Zymomonas mobilis subsp. pomaceae ATCC 29192]|uniref:Uncharacterized protein n=1 Tax=Zymomonas mobilis subsp. pomaceae (strain ATCC 29192 / DSM 22645 / JCM 10191 / CCUG 17912 / NBRC 13757 / NCIMB 11200 / NRRL B-4491 / Barker I) TaxID=579138 RepID=F8ES99_ZYMMT|nr:hypothetical protein Zymop_0773 [Zymomonas mobilis subsp. pomaceae ATCC 29192]